MKRLGWLVSLVVCWGLFTCHVQADVEVVGPAPVLNEPNAAYDTFVKVVETLDPQLETLYDFGGEFYAGSSIALWKFTSNEIALGSLRLGYAFDSDLANDHRSVYGGLQVDVPGLASRYVPESIQGIATAGPLSTVWSLLGEHTTVSFIGGRDFDQDETILGLSIGGSF